MSSTSAKHRDFIGEPMGDKPVTDLAGIGEALGTKLSDKGFEKAYNVLGKFLILDKDQESFENWLHEAVKANAKQRTECYNCLNDWCNAFL